MRKINLYITVLIVIFQLQIIVSQESVDENNIVTCEQIHLSFTGIETSLSIDFVSSKESSLIEYKSSESNEFMKTLTSSIYNEEIGWLHHAEMRNLVPRTKYSYKIYSVNDDVGDEECTEWIEFEAGYPIREDGSDYRIGDSRNDNDEIEGAIAAVYADFGLANDVSMKHIQEEGLKGKFDYGLHIGDISYDLFTNKSTVGNEFMRQVSAVYKHKPLMVAAGNHEHNDNFTQYTQRFKAQEEYAGANSGSGTSFFYSFDVGLIHYVIINTEVYKYQKETASSPLPFSPEEQLKWLEEDLKLANKSRKQVPWIVMAGHKGWYMNEFSGTRCIFADSIKIVLLMIRCV